MSDLPTESRLHSLLGKQVRVSIDKIGPTIVTGKLLGFGQGGEFEILCADGMVHFCWPLLVIQEEPEQTSGWQKDADYEEYSHTNAASD